MNRKSENEEIFKLGLYVKYLKEAFFFHGNVPFWYQKGTSFKVIYSNQFKRYRYVQGIWVVANSMENMMVKKFRARAHFRARAGRIFCLLGQNLMIFEYSQQDNVWRAPRAQMCAHPKFFY